MEARARQILRLRFSRSHKRFETMLQGTRRIPTEEELTEDELKAVVIPETLDLPEPIVQHPFFARHFSTFAHRSTAFLCR